ncbi:MAG: tetratricopeptide repeat protein [Nannocystis sp.]|nr:tetratricopeptide repeat protein [Nannocystis sp.]
MLRNQGDHAAALEPYQRALLIREAAQGPEHPALGYHLHGLGLSHLALGDLAAARVELERAVALRERTGEPAKLAGSQFGLAKVLWADGERARALELAMVARDRFRGAGPGSANDLARVEAWLQQHAP